MKGKNHCFAVKSTSAMCCAASQLMCSCQLMCADVVSKVAKFLDACEVDVAGMCRLREERRSVL